MTYKTAVTQFKLQTRDQRVIDFFQRVPMNVVVRNGWTKHVARTAYSQQLGKVAWHSDKEHLGPQATRAVLLAAGERVERALINLGSQTCFSH